jgi:hypothetical protein
MIDADVALKSQVVPEFLLMLLLRHVMADSCTELSSAESLIAIPSNYCEVEDLPETLQLRGGEATHNHL